MSDKDQPGAFGRGERTIIRPNPAMPASLNTRRVFTSMPEWALITITAVSTARKASIVWPIKSG